MATIPGVDQPLSDLTEVVSPDIATSLLYLVDGATSKKITGTNLRAVFITDVTKAELAAALQAEIDAKADITDTAIKAFDNVFSGENTFGTINVPTGTLDDHAVNKQQLDIVESNKADLVAVVLLTSNQTIAGIKTFSQSPIVPTPTLATQAANKDYVDTKPNQTDELVVSDSLTESISGTAAAQDTVNQEQVVFAKKFPETPTKDNYLIWDTTTQKYIEQDNSREIIEGFLFEDISDNPVTPADQDVEFVENETNNTITMQSKSGKTIYRLAHFQEEGKRATSRVNIIEVTLPVVWDLDNFTSSIRQVGFDSVALKLSINYVTNTVSTCVGVWANPANEGGKVNCYALPTLNGILIAGAGRTLISAFSLNDHGFLFDVVEQNRVTGSLDIGTTSFKLTQTFSQWRGANILNPKNKLSPRIRTISEIEDGPVFISYIDSSGEIQFLRPNPGLPGIDGYTFPGLPEGISALYGYIDESLDLDPTSINRLVELDDISLSEEAAAIDISLLPEFVICSYPLIGNSERIQNIGNSDNDERTNAFKSFAGIAPSLNALGLDTFNVAGARERVAVFRGQATVWHEDFALLLTSIEGGGFSQQGNTNSNAISYDPKGNTVEDELTFLNTKTKGINANQDGVVVDTEAIKINAKDLIKFNQTIVGEVDLSYQAETVIVSLSRNIQRSDIGKSLIIDSGLVEITLVGSGLDFAPTRIVDNSPDKTGSILIGAVKTFMFGETLIVYSIGFNWYFDRSMRKAESEYIKELNVPESVGGYITPYQARYVSDFGEMVYNANVNGSGSFNVVTIQTPYYLGIPEVSDMDLMDGMKIRIRISINSGKTATGNGIPGKLINVTIDSIPSKIILNSYKSTADQQVSALESENLFIDGSIVDLTYNESLGGFTYRIIEEDSEGIDASPISNGIYFLDGNRGFYKRINGVILMGITPINTNDSTSNQWNTYYTFPNGYRSINGQIQIGKFSGGGSTRLNGSRINSNGQFEFNWFQAGGFVQLLDTKRWEVRRP